MLANAACVFGSNKKLGKNKAVIQLNLQFLVSGSDSTFLFL